MNTLTKNFVADLSEKGDSPCLSLYQATHRHHPENQQDPIRYGNLVKDLEESLLQQLPKEEIRPLLKPFMDLAEDRNFWNHTLDGLAILASKDFFRVCNLQRPVADLVVVADSFHTKPLMRILQSVDRYQILAVNQQEVKLFEGTRDTLDEIELAEGAPWTITEALGEELTESHQTVASYGGRGNGASPMHHGHGGKSSEVEDDAERFFRVIDRGILNFHSKPSGIPLILAALPQHHHLFHEVSHNPFLIPQSIDVHPDSLSSMEELRHRAWQLMEPFYLARLDALVEEYGNAHSGGLSDDDLAQIAKAVVGGRVATLLIEARRVIPGKLNASTGEIEYADLAHPEVDDVLDDLSELTLKMGGQVVVLPTERMPTATGAAAIYRY